MTLNATKIRDAVDIAPTEIEVPEWGGSLFVREMSVKERWDFQKKFAAETESDDRPELWLLINGTCDKDGKPIFADADREWLADKSGRVVESVALEVLKANGLADDTLEEAGNG